MQLGTKQDDDAYISVPKVRIFRCVDFEELWHLTLVFFTTSPQIRLICLKQRTFLDRYNNKSCSKFQLTIIEEAVRETCMYVCMSAATFVVSFLN
jgi:hypothetical protein